MKKTPLTISTSLLAGFIVFLLGACSPNADVQTTTEEQAAAEQLDEANISEIRSAVKARMDELKKFAEAGDLESCLRMYDESGSYIDNVYRYASYQEFVDSYRKNWNVASQKFDDTTDVFVLSPEVALAVATGKVTQTDKQGNTSAVQWAFTSIWVQQDGQWKIHSFHQVGEELK